MPHDKTQKNHMGWITICESLVNCKIYSFPKPLIIGNEKWVPYNNVKRKRLRTHSGETAQTMSKPGLTVRKVLVMCLVRLAETPSTFTILIWLWIVTIGSFEVNNHIEAATFGQWERNYVPLGQRHSTRSNCDSPAAPRVWLRDSYSTTLGNWKILINWFSNW